MVDEKNNKFESNSGHDDSANQGGQQGESQSSAPSPGRGIGSGHSGNALPSQPRPTALPPPKVSIDKGDGDNPHNPGGKSNP